MSPSLIAVAFDSFFMNFKIPKMKINANSTAKTKAKAKAKAKATATKILSFNYLLLLFIVPFVRIIQFTFGLIKIFEYNSLINLFDEIL